MKRARSTDTERERERDASILGFNPGVTNVDDCEDARVVNCAADTPGKLNTNYIWYEQHGF